MTLRLSVVSEHGIRLGPHSTKVFGVHGGTIGRATDNAWILPDPERYLSGKHVRIDFRAGTYVLVDTSSNGTYVNGAQVPLGKYHDYVLKDGDYIRLGEYELLVSIDKSNDFPPDESAIVAYDGEAKSSAVKKSTANDVRTWISANSWSRAISWRRIRAYVRAMHMAKPWGRRRNALRQTSSRTRVPAHPGT
jgi:type VI secretion system FHA domain protein